MRYSRKLLRYGRLLLKLKVGIVLAAMGERYRKLYSFGKELSEC
jgi:hypothetical protein